MLSLLEKISQRLHAIVDRALEARSLALYDQYVRDVEAYGRQIEESAATMYAGIQANKRRLARHEEEAQRIDRRVDELVLAGEEDKARILQRDLEVQQQLVATTRRQIANQEADHRRLLRGRKETDERLQLMRGERPGVESLMAMIRAGQLMEQIELTLAGLAQLGEESAAGRIAASIQRRFDEAELRWQMAAADLQADAALAAAEESQVDDQLAERMRRLGLEETN
jgi:phage shock protein A